MSIFSARLIPYSLLDLFIRMPSPAIEVLMESIINSRNFFFNFLNNLQRKKERRRKRKAEMNNRRTTVIPTLLIKPNLLYCYLITMSILFVRDVLLSNINFT